MTEDLPLHELAGGEAGLRPLIEDFYDRVLVDVMIGFHFRGKDRERLVQKELELALSLLGAEVDYTGMPLREAHAPHPILGGQFDRRTQLLRETMADHQLPEPVQRAWLEHTERLRSLITGDGQGECRQPS